MKNKGSRPILLFLLIAARRKYFRCLVESFAKEATPMNTFLLGDALCFRRRILHRFHLATKSVTALVEPPPNLKLVPGDDGCGKKDNIRSEDGDLEVINGRDILKDHKRGSQMTIQGPIIVHLRTNNLRKPLMVCYEGRNVYFTARAISFGKKKVHPCSSACCDKRRLSSKYLFLFVRWSYALQR